MNRIAIKCSVFANRKVNRYRSRPYFYSSSSSFSFVPSSSLYPTDWLWLLASEWLTDAAECRCFLAAVHYTNDEGTFSHMILRPCVALLLPFPPPWTSSSSRARPFVNSSSPLLQFYTLLLLTRWLKIISLTQELLLTHDGKWDLLEYLQNRLQHTIALQFIY